MNKKYEKLVQEIFALILIMTILVLASFITVNRSVDLMLGLALTLGYLSVILRLMAYPENLQYSMGYKITWPISWLIARLIQKREIGYQRIKIIKSSFRILTVAAWLFFVMAVTIFVFNPTITRVIIIELSILLVFVSIFLINLFLKNKKKSGKDLRRLSLLELVLEYIESTNPIERELYFEAFSKKAQSNSLSQLEIKILTERLSSLSFKKAQEKIPPIIEIYKPKDSTTILCTRAYWQANNDLPFLFKYTHQKKAVILDFLQSELESDYLWSKTKQELRKTLGIPKIFYILNSLEFSYKKDWEEEEAKQLVKVMGELINFLTGITPLIWNENEREQCSRYLEGAKIRYKKNGILVNIP